MTDTSFDREAARRVRHRQAARAAHRAAWSRLARSTVRDLLLARSTVRDLLLAGPAGGDPLGEAIVALLDAGDLLSHDGFVAQCVEVARDEEPLTWADLDQERLRACARTGLPLELDPAQRRLIQLSVTLLDLAGHLHDLGPVATQAATSALQAVLTPPRPGKAGACAFWDAPHDFDTHVVDAKAGTPCSRPALPQAEPDWREAID